MLLPTDADELAVYSISGSFKRLVPASLSVEPQYLDSSY